MSFQFGRIHYAWVVVTAMTVVLMFGSGWNETAPAGSFPNGSSPYGVLDLAGNV